MAPIKFTYFNATALGEPVRMLLAYGGLDFEDERLTGEEFALRKATLPYGTLPVLEIEGRTLWQSMAMCRFLAGRVGLAGKDEWENLDIDMQVDTVGDLRTAMAGVHYEKNEEIKKQKRELVMSTQVPFYLERMEAHLTKNGGHFVNGKLTWADIWFAGVYEYLNYIADEDIFDKRPQLQALKKKVMALPKLQKYLSSRPETPF